MSSSNKWQVSNTNTLCHILSLSDCAPIWKMARKKVSKEDYQFKVPCVSYINLRPNKAFKEKFDNYFSNQFYTKNS